MNRVWNVAIYARVSTDKKEQVESIPAQVESLKQWLMKKSLDDENYQYKLFGIYEDCGFSGSNFNREDFARMKNDIDKGLINMVLTRDLSRFARNYVTAGYYLEDYFKEREIRFVSVLDNVDTIDEVDDIVPFKNILNEMYIKDCSRKTRDGLRQRMIRGSSISSKPPYGYSFQESWEGNIKTIKLIPKKDETTDTVRRIFTLYKNGWGMGRIANYLNEREIAPPSARLENFKGEGKRWGANSVRAILTNPKYGGYMVQGRWKKVSYKIKKVKEKSREEWINGGEFEGIIDKNEYQKVQEIIESRGKTFRYKEGTVHKFSGVLQCGECGGGMCYRKKFKGYKCTNSQKGGGVCTAHSVKEELLEEYVLGEIRVMVERAGKEKLVKKVMDEYEKNSKPKNQNKREVEWLNRELKKIETRFENMYIDKLDGKIDDDIFENMKGKFENQKRSLLEKIRVKNGENNNIDFGKTEELIRSIFEMKTLDRTFIENFIYKIIVTQSGENKIIKVYFRMKNF